MDKRMQRMREKQKKRRELLAKQLGVGHADNLSLALSSKTESAARAVIKRPASASEHFSSKVPKAKIPRLENQKPSLWSLNKDNKDSDGELNVYKDSSTFLKGTQSLNPHNDYCQNYVDTGQRPQNFIRDVGLAERFGEYPKLKDLIRLKDEQIRSTNTPPTYLKCDLTKFDMRKLGCKFDVLLIDPPLQEYKKRAGLPLNGSEASWDDVLSLEIDEVAASRSFVFLWCGSSDGLDSGRMCLKKWGFRRCEDICWIKTNLKQTYPSLEDESLFVRTKEHCLMGIKGTVRRSTDGDFIHANVDIDLIIEEEQEPGSGEKPEEIFHLIEHFCLGRRRLHLYGRDTSIRPGWLTVGPQLTNSNFDRETYSNQFKSTDENPTGNLTGCTEEIERLRPKTPPPREKKNERGGHSGPPSRGGRGRGAPTPRRGNGNAPSVSATPSHPVPRDVGQSTAPTALAPSYSQFHDVLDGARSYRDSKNPGVRKRDSGRDWAPTRRDGGHMTSRKPSHSNYSSR
ncbi:unnamed protein product [Clavelina lepadiformis]|uniref:N(6)-adenosine-methyltransferase non-catalytic subunit METTL14 n=1 Tax=Clavelina lepadiformis TaxID=159417 RepID=A0ABP0G8L2_CLALP